ncbi:DUF1697 domain-containing protein [Paraconexibacter antarcticus]|uniref:DUF1697 domain-containing protein n=1 Tax=Paraconexibacter antarcticus TaxID=2949664 RepID=A0ABY5DVP6_9ACTN|nr:DUF1697 domain-containing protein [Paraconexibacter antarcticus]UTI65146.1 DUF1697 domain-containing protein [Paraconexibacter antarcticus]
MRELVVLLRGINVGQAKQVPMTDLRALLQDAGYGDVRTLLRSGNVVLTAGAGAPATTAATVAADVSERIGARFGFPVEVVVRTGAQLRRVAAADPFDGTADDPARRHVAFLSGAPDRQALAALLRLDATPERLARGGRTDLHLWTPDGMARSVLAKELGRAKLGVVVTVRNWNTVQKLVAMTG